MKTPHVILKPKSMQPYVTKKGVKMTHCIHDNTDCKSCGHHYCIKSIPLFSSMNQKEIEQLSESITTKQYAKGQVVFDYGEKASGLYIVCQGKLKIYKNTLDGKEQILYILKHGDFIGAFNLLKEDVFQFTARAIEGTTVSMLSKEAFNEVVLAHPEMTLKILEKAYERIMKVESLVERLSTKNLDAKVAGLLVNLIPSFGIKTKEGVRLELSINREEMGSYAGIARETITRKLRLFEEMGIINLIGAKVIEIRDLYALKAYL